MSMWVRESAIEGEVCGQKRQVVAEKGSSGVESLSSTLAASGLGVEMSLRPTLSSRCARGETSVLNVSWVIDGKEATRRFTLYTL